MMAASVQSVSRLTGSRLCDPEVQEAGWVFFTLVTMVTKVMVPRY
jgi:hypothetical protein